MIAIIDYGAGNLTSVRLAFESLGLTALITQVPSEIRAAERVVFPGVGAAGAAMQNLGDLDLVQAIRSVVQSGTPFLGICLGCQMLARVLGGTVAPHPEGKAEIGYYPIDITDAGSRLMEWPEHVYQWHREGFTTPRNSEILIIFGKHTIIWEN